MTRRDRASLKTANAKKEKEAKQKAADIVNGIVTTQARIVLMDMILPNGLALSECTGPDCRAAGGWLVKVADLVGDSKVGDVLDEAKLRSIYAARSRKKHPCTGVLIRCRGRTATVNKVCILCVTRDTRKRGRSKASSGITTARS